jgi:Xaa-Pro aminopeptidase
LPRSHKPAAHPDYINQSIISFFAESSGETKGFKFYSYRLITDRKERNIILKAIESLQHHLPQGCDAAIIVSVHNRRYFAGFSSSDGLLFVTKSRACLLVDFRYIEAARASAQGCEVILLENRREQLLKLAQECCVTSAAIEARELPVAEFMRFKCELPTVRFDESTALSDTIERLRMIKQVYEIENVKKAQEITDEAFSHILKFIKPGVAERELALEIEYFMRSHGAESVSFDLIVVSGENSALPHGVPGTRKIKSGDFVTMDTGAVVGGYCSDMTRTVAIGCVSAAMRHVYDTVLRAQLAAEQAIHAGVMCSAVDKIARDIIYDAGYQGCFGHGLGHSVGLQIHEEPRLSPLCGELLMKNMLMTVEPGVYLEGMFGVRIEDLVLITDKGCEILTSSPKELMIL